MIQRHVIFGIGFFFLLTPVLLFSASKIDSKSDSEQKSKAVVETAIFAGGCFWCMQPPYDRLKEKGVLSTRVGYAGGSKEDPTYKEVSAGGTGHREVIEVTFDPKKISYPEILKIFWNNIDPLDADGQFCDKGLQYTSAIFALTDSQKKEAEESFEKVQSKMREKGRIQTKILGKVEFYPAETYHQDYYRKNPLRYRYYRYSCGRDARLEDIWGEAAEH